MSHRSPYHLFVKSALATLAIVVGAALVAPVGATAQGHSGILTAFELAGSAAPAGGLDGPSADGAAASQPVPDRDGSMGALDPSADPATDRTRTLLYAGMDIQTVACQSGIADPQECFLALSGAIFGLIQCVKAYAGFWAYLGLKGLSAAAPAAAITAVGLISWYLYSRGVCTLALTTFFVAIDYCLERDEGTDGEGRTAMAQLQRLTSTSGIVRPLEA